MAARKEINFKTFEGLCQIHCTKSECAGILDISEDTLERRIKEHYGEKATFAAIFKEKSAHGKASIRRKQYKKAVEDGNVTMLIWLGKNWLGQSDDPQVPFEDEPAYPEVNEPILEVVNDNH